MELFVWKLRLIVVAGDRVSNEQQLTLRMSLDRLDDCLMSFCPPWLAESVNWNDCGVHCASALGDGEATVHHRAQQKGSDAFERGGK